MTPPRIAGLLAAVAAVVVGTVVFDASILKSVVAVLICVAVLWIGLVMIRGLAAPVPEPPDPGELRKVKLVYQCTICGTEVRMTAAVSEDPEPPRHCLEDMQLLTPIE